VEDGGTVRIGKAWALAVALAAIAFVVLSPPSASVARSKPKPVYQKISDTQLRKAKHGKVRVLFAVTYPEVARRSSRASVRVTVFTAPRRGTPIRTFDKRIRRQRGKKVFASVSIRGRAARVLRRSGLNRLRTLKMVLITSRDERQVDRDRFADFIQMVTRPASADPRRAPVGRVPAKTTSKRRLGGDAVNVVVQNNSSQSARVTAAPLGCVYDGASNSSVSALNIDVPPKGGRIAHRVEKDANTGHKFVSGFGLAPSSGYGGGTIVTPALADGLYNPSVKGLLFAAINKYTSIEASPQIFLGQLNVLPDRSEDTCATTKGNFVIAADRYTPGSGPRPTDARDGAVFQIAGNGDIKMTAGLADFSPVQVGIVQSNSQTIVIQDGVAPACGDPETEFPVWLSCRLPVGGQLAANKRLVDLSIPGSHDSATASAASDNDWYFKHKGSCSSYEGIYETSPGKVYNAAFTQTLTIPDQLDAGIRYLDLRLAYDAGSGSGKMSDPGDQWRFLHTMFVQSSVRAEAQDIANWARTHPGEIVIADMNHICTSPDTSLTAEQQYNQLFADLATPDPVTGLSLCDVAYQLPAGVGMESIPSTTLAAVRASGRNVIVPADGIGPVPGCGVYPINDWTGNNDSRCCRDGLPINHLWPEESGPNVCSDLAPWENIPAADRIAQYPLGYGGDYTADKFGKAHTLATYRSASPPPFTQAQATPYTADTAGIIFGVILGCGSLQKYEMPFITHYRAGVLNTWGSDMNIVIGDFVTADDYIQRIILNGPG
jgi:hypothetical protein